MQEVEKNFLLIFVALVVFTILLGIGKVLAYDSFINGSVELSEPLVRENSLFLPTNSPNYQDYQVLGTKHKPEPTPRELIEKYFPESQWDYAEAVMYCESSGNPEAVNWEYHNSGSCHGSFGLFQIGCNNVKNSYEDMYDPERNVKKALHLYERRGWQPWPNCP